MTAEDYSQAIGVYDEFLKHYPNVPDANEVRLLRGLAELRVAEKKATASGDWTAGLRSCRRRRSRPCPRSTPIPTSCRSSASRWRRSARAWPNRRRAIPTWTSVDRLQSVVNMLETDIPEDNRPTKMLDEIKGILKHGKQEVEGRRELDQTVDAIRAAVEANDAPGGLRGLSRARPVVSRTGRRCPPDRCHEAGLGRRTKGGQARRSSRWPRCTTERPSGLLAAMPLAVQPVKGELAEGRGKLVFVVEQGTAYGLDAATGKTLWRRFVALDPENPAGNRDLGLPANSLRILGTAQSCRRDRAADHRPGHAATSCCAIPCTRNCSASRARRASSSGDWPSDSRSSPSRCGRASGCCC